MPPISSVVVPQPPQTSPLPLTAGLVLSPAAEPIPRKLVDKVQSGQFVEMRELLSDNISLVHQLESIQGFSPLNLLGATRIRLREITSLSTWIYCFLGYVAIRTSDPTARDQLAYARLIVREALRHGGAGWLDYDRAFRQQAAADPSLRWNTILPGLQASTMLGHGSSQGAQFCTLCRKVAPGLTVPSSACNHQHSAPPLHLLDADRTMSAYHGIEVPASSQASMHIDTYVRPVSFPSGLKIVPKLPIAPRSNSSVARRCSRVPKLQSTLVPDLLFNCVFT